MPDLLFPRGHFGKNIFHAFTETNGDTESLFPAEREIIHNAMERRASEFVAGRNCARNALHELGYTPTPLLKGASGEPLWPVSICGSISHCGQIAGCIAASRQHYRSLGLDIAEINSIPAQTDHILFTPTELNYLSSLPSATRDRAATLLFSMKEAYYKLQYPITGTFLEFTDVEVRQTAAGGFSCNALSHVSAITLPEPIPMQYHFIDTNIYTWCSITNIIP